MDAELKVLKKNLHLWNSKLLKLEQQQYITKNYLPTNIKNLQINNETLQKLETFMAEVEANPKFINHIIVQLQQEQKPTDGSFCVGRFIWPSFPFLMPNLKRLLNPNLSFVYKLFDMVSDPNTNSVILWSKSGTSFILKDPEGLHNHVQERFSYSVRTFYNMLNDFGLQCVDKFLHEYANDNFQRDKKHMLKNMTSKRKLLAAKKKIQSILEEELKRLGFFQNELKLNISSTKEKDKITVLNLRHAKRFLESATNRITQEEKEKEKVKTECERRASLDPNADIGRLKHDLYKLHMQIFNLEQGISLVKNQLDDIEGILPSAERKQKDIELSMNKLFKNPTVIPRKKGKGKKQVESQELSNGIENDNDLGHEDLKISVGILEGELTFSW